MCGYIPGVNELDANEDVSEDGARAPGTGIGHVLVAIDTSLGTGVAVSKNGRVFEARSADPRGHAEVVAALLDEVLSEAGVTPREVEGVVAGMGPGSFTGLRVGIAAAKAFALGAGAPVLPLSGHEAVALKAFQERSLASARIVQDAKRREFFVSEYGRGQRGGLPSVISAARTVAQEGFQHREGDEWPEEIPLKQLLQLASLRLDTGQDFLPEEAIYLRQPDVREPEAPKRVVP